ncbi:glycosyltransferase [Catenovulum sediminis]|uniref:glycosyltransferase n=1 Tax=Catenovulum sediminis TaxID=1740262 RepID=UPI00117D9D6E|nr:glycosyltransferase [Catenovulum sediminis]
MSKLSKLINSPALYFRDALDNYIKRTSNGKKHNAIPAEKRKAGNKKAVVSSKRVVNKYDPKAIYSMYYESSPLDPNTVLYEAFHGSSVSDSPYAIFKKWLEIDTEKKFKHIWALKHLGEIPEELKNNPQVSFVEVGSKEYVRFLCTSKYLFNNSTFPSYFIRRKEQVYVNTWHGVPLKKMFKDEGSTPTVHKNSARNFLQASHIVLPNEYTARKLLNSADVDNLVFKSRVQTSNLRADLILSADPLEQKKKLGIDACKKVILYAPTWRGELNKSTSNATEILSFVQSLKRNLGDEYEVVLSVHNMARKHIVLLDDSIKIINENIEINEFLSAVDVLISDYSSIIFDYLVLSRPVILYCYDLQQYESSRGFYFAIQEFPASVCMDEESVLHCIKNNDYPDVDTSSVKPSEPFYMPKDEGGASRLIHQLLEPEAVAYEEPRKKKIIAYVGGLRNNGITTSAVNLSKSIDHEKFELTIVTAGSDIDNDEERKETLLRFDNRCSFIHKAGAMCLSKSEKNLLDKFYKHNVFFSDEHLMHVNRVFERESKRLLGDIQWDIVIDFSGYARYWALLLANTSAKTKVIYQHNDMLSEQLARFPILKGIFEVYNLFDKIISVSKPTMNLNISNLLPLYPKLKGKFDYVHNAIVPDEIKQKSLDEGIIIHNLERFVPNKIQTRDGRVKLEGILLPKDEMINFVNVGRLSPEKDQTKLILAFKTISQKYANCHLYIMGAGPLEATLLELIEELDLTERVSLTGQLSNPFYFVSKCDCFVSSSNYEGQPMVLLEALTIGLPVISTNIPGSASVLQNKYGHLVENSIAGLVSGMDNFLSNDLESSPFCPHTYVEHTKKMFETKVCQL